MVQFTVNRTLKYVCQIHKSSDAMASSRLWAGHHHNNIDLSMLLDNFFIPNAYSQCYLTYLENYIALLFGVGIEYLYCWVFLSIQL